MVKDGETNRDNLINKRQSRFFYSCLWVFMLQATLMYLVLWELTIVPYQEGHLVFKVYSYETFLAQFVAATLLHMELIREVQQGVNMIKYLAYNTEKFNKPAIPLIIACMQMLGGLFAEVCNLLVLTQRHDPIHCLEHFVAFEILTSVDNIYFAALPNFPMK